MSGNAYPASLTQTHTPNLILRVLEINLCVPPRHSDARNAAVDTASVAMVIAVIIVVDASVRKANIGRQ